MKNLIFLILLVTTTASADIYCEIYDLATADIFASVQSDLTLEKLKQSDAEFNLKSHLVSSDFYISWNPLTSKIHLKIYSKEFTSDSSSVFELDESKFSRKFRMGFNAIELTGLGDNVHSRCDWAP